MEHNDPLTVAQAISDYGPYAVILAFVLVLFLYCICNVNIKGRKNTNCVLAVCKFFRSPKKHII